MGWPQGKCRRGQKERATAGKPRKKCYNEAPESNEHYFNTPQLVLNIFERSLERVPAGTNR
jgi:hypothetical protein